MQKTIIAIVVVVLLAAGGYFFYQRSLDTEKGGEQGVATSTPEEGAGATQNASSTSEKMTTIGTSAGNRAITAYHFGMGTTTELLFIGGIHGGYEWNTALVAYELMAYLEQNESVIPTNVRVTVVPVLNPDGLSKVLATTTSLFAPSDVAASSELRIAGRFNGNTVDLNRNFDCDWKAEGKWQEKTVSGGSKAFSEPESQAIRDYVAAHKIAAVVVWYSSAGGVFASNCHNGVSEATRTLMNTYAKASAYPAYDSFDFYEITGDMVNWFAKNNIPAISVLLTAHDGTEWAKNKAGIEAVLKSYAK